ncbi:FadR/GntR family transcriptional regulator [Sinorhizobium meliloti]|uniref:FadR/GntR family transcriptional regulator n=1 Tax=Rhizobium meliloti TaxID=382 RepID=UPI00398CA5E8
MKNLMPLAPELTSAPDMVFRRLREAIATGDLGPGDQLPAEIDLGRMLGVSTVTVRVALGVMRDMGLLTTVRGRNGGNFIASDVGERLADAARRMKLTRTELRDITDWRRAISGEACFLTAERGSDADFTRIRKAADEFDSLLSQFPDLRFADARFHTLIAETSRSARLAKEEIDIQIELTNFILATAKPVSAKGIPSYSHQRIITAIFNRNGEAARKAMIDHAEDTFKWSTAVIS